MSHDWKAAAKSYREDAIHATQEYVALADDLILEQNENFDLRATVTNHDMREEASKLAQEILRLRAALTEIAGCNGGKGYMPELAKKALEGT